MIKEYGLYNFHKEDNKVVIKFSPLEINKEEKIDNDVGLLYSNDELVGYALYDFLRFVKIKYSGIIFFPVNPLVDVVNSILENHHLEILAYKKESGYITKRNNGVLMVYSKPGTFLRDGDISKGKDCSYYDLDIEEENDKELFEINEDIPERIDFFKTEVI